MSTKFRSITAGVALSVMALTGCASTPSTVSPTTEAVEETTEAAEETTEAAEEPTGEESAETPAAAGPTTLAVAESSLGEIVVDADGMTVYYFTKDEADSGVSACTGECLAAWPPVISEGEAPEVDGVTGEVGTIETPEGELQMTINGMPIYYFEKDMEAGDVNGQGVGGVWYVVAPDGTMIQ